MMRVLLCMAFLLSGCAALPVAGWVAVGAVAGAVSATAQLDIVVINGYLSLQGKKVAPATPPAKP